MSAKLHFMCFFVLTSALISSMDCKHFCRAFRANNDSISYTFRTDFDLLSIPSGDNSKFEIIINGQHWTLDYTDRPKQSLAFAKVDDNKPCPLFTNDYIVALTRTSKSDWAQSRAFLFERNNLMKVKIATPLNPSPDYKDLVKYTVTKNETMGGDTPIGKPFLVFSEDFSRDAEASILKFVRREGNRLKLQAFTITESGSAMTLTRQTSIRHVGALEGVSEASNVLAIIPRFSYTLGWHGGNYSYVLLWKDALKINWCLSGDTNLKCEKKLLINCGAYPQTEPPEGTDPEVTEKGGSAVLIIVIILVVVALIIVIGVVVFFCCNKSPEEGDATSTISAAGPEGALSQRSADVQTPSKMGASKVASGVAKTPSGVAKTPSGAAKTPSSAAKAGTSGVKSTAK